MEANYTVPANSVVHTVSADFIKSLVNEPVRLVQGDKTLPVIAVKLYINELQYTIPTGATAYLNVSINTTGVYYKIPAAGYNVVNNETIVYFIVDDTLTDGFGTYKAIISVELSDSKVGSSYFNITINKHPIQPGAVPYTVEINGSEYNAVVLIHDLLARVEALESQLNNNS